MLLLGGTCLRNLGSSWLLCWLLHVPMLGPRLLRCRPLLLLRPTRLLHLRLLRFLPMRRP